MLQPLRKLFQFSDHPALLVGLEEADDAAVYQINETQAIVTTTDFFPPVVDDPYDFGAIAAANAMSDIYAMGGTVLFAMNIVCFPDTLAPDILRRILQGGAEKVAEAGGAVVGGHSVIDQEPKYGLAVIGMIDPAEVRRKKGARPGDVLVLTKSLGVGVITTALKQGTAAAADVAAAVQSMSTLNQAASAAALRAGAHGMTDITGFGLLGHAHEMASQSGVDFHIRAESLPWLPGALEYGTAGIFPGGKGRNHLHYAQYVHFEAAVSALHREMLWTPETSGGLLVALAPDDVDRFLTACPAGVVIGHVRDGSGQIQVGA